MIQSKRNEMIDILKIIAIIFVVIIHCKFTDEEVIKYGFVFNLRTVVPVFMILTGYVLSMSFDKNKINSFDKAYELKYILKRIVRFLIPYIIIVLIELLFNYFVLKYDLISKNNLFYIIQGGFGKGGYYNTIVIQTIFLFPLLYFLIKRKKEEGLLYAFLINLLYEIIKTCFLMNEEFYRLVAFRYIFVISLGIYLYFSKKEIQIWKLFLSFIIGATIIYIFDYTRYNPIFINYWKDTSLLLGFYVFPIIWLAVKKIKIKKRNFQLITLLSKSSYNIFLFQMVFYYIIDSLNYSLFSNRILNITCCLFICLIGGVVFYKFEYIITNKIVKLIDKIDYNKINDFKRKLFHF